MSTLLAVSILAAVLSAEISSAAIVLTWLMCVAASPSAPPAPWPFCGPWPLLPVRRPGPPSLGGPWAWGPRPGACVSSPASPPPALIRLASPYLGVDSPAQIYLGELQTEHVVDPVVIDQKLKLS